MMYSEFIERVEKSLNKAGEEIPSIKEYHSEIEPLYMSLEFDNMEKDEFCENWIKDYRGARASTKYIISKTRYETAEIYRAQLEEMKKEIAKAQEDASDLCKRLKCEREENKELKAKLEAAIHRSYSNDELEEMMKQNRRNALAKISR